MHLAEVSEGTISFPAVRSVTTRVSIPQAKEKTDPFSVGALTTGCLYSRGYCAASSDYRGGSSEVLQKKTGFPLISEEFQVVK